METLKTVVYNRATGEALVSLFEGRSSGGLAQLGEHYVRNVGVGGSTPLPSTKPHFVRTGGSRGESSHYCCRRINTFSRLVGC